MTAFLLNVNSINIAPLVVRVEGAARGEDSRMTIIDLHTRSRLPFQWHTQGTENHLYNAFEV